MFLYICYLRFYMILFTFFAHVLYVFEVGSVKLQPQVQLTSSSSVLKTE